MTDALMLVAVGFGLAVIVWHLLGPWVRGE